VRQFGTHFNYVLIKGEAIDSPVVCGILSGTKTPEANDPLVDLIIPKMIESCLLSDFYVNPVIGLCLAAIVFFGKWPDNSR
jgi:hypothetical protein